MTHIIADRVRESSTTTGTGSYTLAGFAASGFRTFASVMTAPSDTCWGFVEDGVNWEVGHYTLTGATTLARTKILASSNGGSAINWGVGSRNIVMDMPASVCALFATGWINVRRPPYNAVGNGIADDTAAIQAAINATPFGGTLYIPAGAYRLIGSGSGCLNCVNNINIIGDGWGTVLFADSTVPATRDIILCAPTLSLAGWSFRNFQINSGVFPIRGRHGIHIEPTAPAATAYNVEIKKVFVTAGLPGGKSIRATNIAYSEIEECNVDSIELADIGDSVGVSKNTITAVAGSAVAIYVKQVAGAANARIVGNVIATLGAHVLIDAATTPIIRDNEFESPNGLTNVFGSLVMIRGATSQILSPQILNNQFSVLAGTGNPVPIAIINAHNTVISGGRMFVASGNHITIGAGVVDTCIDGNIEYATANVFGPATIGDAGTGTSRGLRSSLGVVGQLAIYSAADRLSGTPFFQVGSSAPVHAAAQGTLYLRVDGSSPTTRAYINTNGSTGWTSVTTAA